MKRIKLLFTLFISLNAITISAQQQTDTLFYESFDSWPWQMTRSGNLLFAPLFEYDSVVTLNNSLYSATDTVGIHQMNGTPVQSYLTTPIIRNISTYADIAIEFHHIAYIEKFDNVFVQISLDNGSNWITLDTSHYNGSSFMKQNFGFCKISRPVDWRLIPTNDTSFIWTNSNAIWAKENFSNIANLIQTSGSDSIKVRINLEDSPVSTPGRVGTHRYYIEDFRVVGLRTVSLNEGQSQFESKLKLYPNPVENNLYLSNQSKDNLALSVRNISGKEVLQTNAKPQSKLQIDVSALASGVYFVIVKSGVIDKMVDKNR